MKHTMFYLVKKGKKKSLLKLLAHMIKINKVPPEYIKARLKNNSVDYFRKLPQHSQNQENNSNLMFPFSKLKEITVATGNQPENLHPTLMARKLRLVEGDLDSLFTIRQKEISVDISLKEYFSKYKNILKIISYAFLVMNLYWVMGLTVFLPEIMGFKSLYLNNFFLALADLFGVSLMALFLNNTKRSALNTFHLSLILICAVVLLLLHSSPYKNMNFVKIIDLILSCKIF